MKQRQANITDKFPCASKLWLEQQWQENILVVLTEVKNSDFNTDQSGPAPR